MQIGTIVSLDGSLLRYKLVCHYKEKETVNKIFMHEEACERPKNVRYDLSRKKRNN